MTEDRQGSTSFLNIDNIFMGLSLTVVLVTILQCLGNDFIWDDIFLVAEFEGLGDPDRLADILTSSFWNNSSYISSATTDYWRPFTSFLLWLGGFIFGKWAPGFHLLSVMAIVAAATAFAFLLRTLLPKEAGWRIPIWLALVFAIHPLSAEIMCLIANMADHLAFAFLAWQLCLLTRYYLNPDSVRRHHFVLMTLTGFLACCSKELGVLGAVSPVAAYLLARSTYKNVSLVRLRHPLPWIAAITPVVLYMMLRTQILDQSLSRSLGEHSNFSIEVVFLGWGQALWGLIVPVSRGAHTFVSEGQWLKWLLAGGSWLLILSIIIHSLVRNRFLNRGALGLLIALALMLPSLLTIDISEGSLRFPTRYFHLPLAGLLIASLTVAHKNWSKGLRLAAPIFVGLLALLSWIRIDEWEDNVSFGHAEVSHQPDSFYTQINLASSYLHARAFADAERLLNEIDANPAFSEPMYKAKTLGMRGKILILRDNNLQQAGELFEQSLRYAPSNLGGVFDLAHLRSIMGYPHQSVIILEKAAKAPWFQDYRKKEIQKKIEYYKAKQTPPALPGSGDSTSFNP